MEHVPNGCLQDVIDKTTGQIRTFLSELLNGTSQYKSLHNLTEQIEHQYEGRFLIELLQNAHDVLFEHESKTDQGRIEIVIAPEEEPFGALYVANDGAPFSASNFDKISNFGQSDKDPEKSIGNKGIGFRSVLEICREPEIYSRQRSNSRSFDGYCFRFTPAVIELYKGAIHKLLEDDAVLSPISDDTALVSWGETDIKAFRKKYSQKGKIWVDAEMAFLSPYLLPIPLSTKNNNHRLNEFEKRGFATVIRMPFMDNEKKERAKQMLETLDENTILFLERTRLLYLDSGQKQIYIGRNSRKVADAFNWEQIDISVETGEKTKPGDKRYWLWQRTIGGDENPDESEEIRDSVSKLPGRWPTLRKATLSLAVRLGSASEQGRYNIFLPTELQTGCFAHINGPFYGDMSRTNIDTKKDYNKLLLKYTGQMAVDVIVHVLAGKGVEESCAIVDIMAQTPGSAGESWWSLLSNRFQEINRDITREPLLLTDKDWGSVSESSVLPPLKESKVISQELFRKNAVFPAITKGLMSRDNELRGIFAAMKIAPLPSSEDQADTVEKIAEYLHARAKSVDWNEFWYDMMLLFPDSKIKVLIGKKVLLGADGALYASGAGTSVFFRPRMGGQDEDSLPEEVVEAIPSNLRPYIAFLHDSIQTHVPRKEGGYQLTPVQKYLSLELVKPFSVEDIFREVLIKKTPHLPIKLRSKESELCKDIIQWGLRLSAGLFARGKGESIIGPLGRLPAPCYGGWFPISEASFGRGWGSNTGGYLDTYLEAADTKETKDARRKLLLPSHDRRWGRAKYIRKDHLERAGVFDGLRLTIAEPKEWRSTFNISGWSPVYFSESLPPCFSQIFWDEYRKSVPICNKPQYSGLFEHRVESLLAIPGLDRWDSLDLPSKKALMMLLLNSMPKWGKSWRNVIVKKTDGYDYSYNPESPLHYLLRNLPWIIIESTEEDGCINIRPGDRWYIDYKTLAGRVHQFTHLNPLPLSISGLIDKSLELKSCLTDLGLPVFDIEEETEDPALLNALADALDNPDSISDQNVFLGQVKGAWSAFRPMPGGPFPGRIIVRKGPGRLALFPTEDKQICYLPDAELVDEEVFERDSVPIVAIDTADAKVHTRSFKRVFGDGIQPISELTVQPLVAGQEYDKDNKEGLQLQNSNFHWIIPVLLSIVANYGGQARGTQTKRFREIMDSMRDVRVVPVSNLERSVWQSGQCILRSTAYAYWLSEAKVLLYTSDCLYDVSKLSDSLTGAMSRSDLDAALKLVLRRFEGADTPSRDLTIDALKEIRVSESQYAEVEQLWLGNLAWTLRLLQPTLLLFNPEIDLSDLAAIKSESDLSEYLSRVNFGSLDTEGFLVLIRTCSGYEEVGRKLFEKAGPVAELAKWNEALATLNEKMIRNTDAKNEFGAHIQSVAVFLRVLLREHVRQSTDSSFPEMWGQIESLRCPENFEVEFWEVPFGTAMNEVSKLMGKLGIKQEICEIIAQADNQTTLEASLMRMGFDTTDPQLIYAINHDQYLKLLEKVQRIAVAWCVKKNISPDGWDVSLDELFKKTELGLKQLGYILSLNEEHFLIIVKLLPQNPAQDELWKQLDDSTSIEDFRRKTGISLEELSKAAEDLKRYKEEAQRKKRIISVCGKDFECIPENFPSLWAHISSVIQDTDVVAVDLEGIEKLDEPAKKKPTGPREHKPGKKPPERLSQTTKDMIGLAGEIHAYRCLLKQYGPAVINPSAWKSSNSLSKFPDNVTDDSFGCDFFFTVGNKQYHIEVKASRGDDEAFDLGPTEIQHAIEVANKRNIKFMILHVTDALTMNPHFRLLPNPYDGKYQRFYRIEEAGLRVRYSLSDQNSKKKA